MRSLWLVAAAIALLALGFIAYKLIAPRSHVLLPPRASNGTEYVLYVHMPPACRSGGCHALYILDGLAWLPTFAALDDELSQGNRIEPLILVGIAYRNEADTRGLRQYDFTPAFGRTAQHTGGAGAFLRVLRDELIPYAEARLPIANDERGLVGHSYAGLFATYALAEAPEVFDRYLIMSPALWFDHGRIYQQNFTTPQSLRHVYLAADAPANAPPGDIANEIAELAALLSAQSNMQVSRALFPGATHTSMVGPAGRRGLVELYGSDSRQ